MVVKAQADKAGHLWPAQSDTHKARADLGAPHHLQMTDRERMAEAFHHKGSAG